MKSRHRRVRLPDGRVVQIPSRRRINRRLRELMYDE